MLSDTAGDVHVIVGLKRLDAAKQRLMPALSPSQRRELMVRMLRSVVTQAKVAQIGEVVLATTEPTAPEIAASLNVAAVSDAALPWNEGLVHALGQLRPRPAAVLYLAGDLPLLTAAEIRRFATLAPGRGVAIGRARDGGTNALLVRPAALMTPMFGQPQSSAAHAAHAAARCVPFRIIDIAGLALDVDTVDDARDAAVLPTAIA